MLDFGCMRKNTHSNTRNKLSLDSPGASVHLSVAWIDELQDGHSPFLFCHWQMMAYGDSLALHISRDRGRAKMRLADQAACNFCTMCCNAICCVADKLMTALGCCPHKSSVKGAISVFEIPTQLCTHWMSPSSVCTSVNVCNWVINSNFCGQIFASDMDHPRYFQGAVCCTFSGVIKRPLLDKIVVSCFRVPCKRFLLTTKNIVHIMVDYRVRPLCSEWL